MHREAIDSGRHHGADLAALYAHRGYIRQVDWDDDGALADYDRAIRLAPDIPDYDHDRAFAHLWLLDLIGALRDWWRAFVLAPFPRWLAAQLQGA